MTVPGNPPSAERLRALRRMKVIAGGLLVLAAASTSCAVSSGTDAVPGAMSRRQPRHRWSVGWPTGSR